MRFCFEIKLTFYVFVGYFNAPKKQLRNVCPVVRHSVFQNFFFLAKGASLKSRLVGWKNRSS